MAMESIAKAKMFFLKVNMFKENAMEVALSLRKMARNTKESSSMIK